MKRFLGTVLAIVAVLAAGCTYSLRPFYLPGQQIFDDRLLGTWVVDQRLLGRWVLDQTEWGQEHLGQLTFEFTEPEASRRCRSMRDEYPEWVCPYHLVGRGDMPDGEGVVPVYEAVLFSLDGKLFLDVSPIAQMELYLPLHVLYRILTPNEPNLRIAAYSGYRSLEEKDGLPREMFGNHTLYTASSKGLQAFLLRHGDELFDDVPIELTRKPAE